MTNKKRKPRGQSARRRSDAELARILYTPALFNIARAQRWHR